MKNGIGSIIYALACFVAACLLFVSGIEHKTEDGFLYLAMAIAVYLIGRDIRNLLKNS
jgi:hypothetical protein